MAIASRNEPTSYFRRLTFLKKLFWLYFILLIFEGALRKWVAPQLSAPLLVIRDPVAIWIIWEAYRTHKWPVRWSAVTALLTVGMVSLFVIQIIAGGNPFIVGLYGLRSYVLPFPLLFIMGENLDEEDLRKLGLCMLWLMLPMALLESAQYLSPSGSFLNRGAYEGGSQIGYVGGHVRAAGTFSFAVGAEQFDALAAPFILYGMIAPTLAKKWLLGVATFGLILSIPMLGSRGVVAQLVLMVGCLAVAGMMGVSAFGKVLRIILPIAIVGFLVTLLPVFSDAMGSMIERFTGATVSEGGTVQSSVLERSITPIVDTFGAADFGSNLMGIGMGRGAVAVQALLRGTTEAVAGENIFEREIGEMGAIGGSAFELFKVLLAITVLGRALAQARAHETLALLLVPAAASTLIFTSLEQTTEQGFMVIAMAFTIAASRISAYPSEQTLIAPLLQRQAVYRRRLQSNGPVSRRPRA